MTIASSASFHAYKLIESGVLVHYHPDKPYHRKALRESIGELRESLDEVEAFLDRTEPTPSEEAA